MRLLDRINEESARALNPSYAILSMNGMAQLIDEVGNEFAIEVSQEDLLSLVGIDALLSFNQITDFVLATACE